LSKQTIPEPLLEVTNSVENFITSYANVFGQSVSGFIRKAALSRIEDELDLRAWNEAQAEYDTAAAAA
jgi:hypothetical protein